MSKGKIIAISIVGFIVLLNAILFGFVFRLRKIDIVVAEGEVSTEQVLNSTGLKTGKSIFLLDKDAAIKSIETVNPKIKVVQIKTKSVTTIEIKVRARYNLYYTNQNEKYYVLDEDLKILEILNDEPTSLINIGNSVTVSEKAKQTDFVGTNYQKNVAYNLFASMYSTVISNTLVGKEAREAITSLIKSSSFENDKLIVLTSEGVTLEIEKPTNNLQTKINTCFATISKLKTDEPAKIKEGCKIKIFYDIQGKEYVRFIDAEETQPEPTT